MLTRHSLPGKTLIRASKGERRAAGIHLVVLWVSTRPREYRRLGDLPCRLGSGYHSRSRVGPGVLETVLRVRAHRPSPSQGPHFDESDRDTPPGETVNEGLGAIDRVNDPNALTRRKFSAAGLFPKKSVLRKPASKSVPNERFDIKIRLAGHVLLPFLLNCEGPEAVEIVERKLSGFFNKIGGELVAGGEIRHEFK